MSNLLNAIALAFVYSLLFAAAVGLLVSMLPFDTSVADWGILLWLILFVVFIFPAWKIVKKANKGE